MEKMIEANENQRYYIHLGKIRKNVEFLLAQI